MGDAIWMGTRDASWFNSPSVDKPVFYHVATGLISPTAACNTWLPLVEESLMPLADLKEHQLCRRPACRNRWAAPTGNPTEGPTAP